MDSEYAHRLGRQICCLGDITEEEGKKDFTVKLDTKEAYTIAKLLSIVFCNECKYRNICTHKEEMNDRELKCCGKGIKSYATTPKSRF